MPSLKRKACSPAVALAGSISAVLDTRVVGNGAEVVASTGGELGRHRPMSTTINTS